MCFWQPPRAFWLARPARGAPLSVCQLETYEPGFTPPNSPPSQKSQAPGERLVRDFKDLLSKLYAPGLDDISAIAEIDFSTVDLTRAVFENAPTEVLERGPIRGLRLDALSVLKIPVPNSIIANVFSKIYIFMTEFETQKRFSAIPKYLRYLAGTIERYSPGKSVLDLYFTVIYGAEVSAPNEDAEVLQHKIPVHKRLTLHFNAIYLSETNEEKLFDGLKEKIKNQEKYTNLEILQLITLADTDKVFDFTKIKKALEYLGKQDQIPEEYTLDYESIFFNYYERKLSTDDGNKLRDILMSKDFRETVIEETLQKGLEKGREEMLEQVRKLAKAKGLERELREIFEEVGAETEKGVAAREKPSRGTAARAKPSPGKAARAKPFPGKSTRAKPSRGTAARGKPSRGTAARGKPSPGTAARGKPSRGKKA